jgi:polyferredoxin
MKRIVYTFLMCFFLQPLILFSQDEFKEWKEDVSTQLTTRIHDTVHSADNKQSDTAKLQVTNSAHQPGKDRSQQYWLWGTLLATILAGVFLRYKATLRVRPFFLVASVAVLGFYRGSCPCPISGLQETLLFFTGEGFHPVRTLWFLALIPVTYFGGRVWCGWICHLGALQELLHFPGKFNFLSSARAQKVMRYIRTIVFVALVIQLVVTNYILWNKIDPFRAAYNLMASHALSWILLWIVLLTSVFIYRPFCKTVCPVGLLLGWISKIPGASAIHSKAGCIGCKACSTACKSHALTFNNKVVTLDQQECIACGECLEACKLKALTLAPTEDTQTEKQLYPIMKA